MPSFDPYILYLPLAERWPLDLAAWLTAGERAELALLADDGRRRQWLAGRLAGKELVVRTGRARRLGDVEIRTRDVLGRGNRPRVRVAGQRFAGSLSITHTAGGVLAALETSDHVTVGVDLVDLADPAWTKLTTADAGGFAQLWFTPLERSWIAADPVRRGATLWAVKEAVYKACQQGHAWSPRDLMVWPSKIASPADGFRCFYRGQPIRGLDVRVWQIDSHLAALAAVRAMATPNNPLLRSQTHELTLRQAS
jgi:phosphopantetheinyl transferase (holo-ACP synthase)